MSLDLLHQLIGGIGILALGVAALLAIIRITRGPSILDRVVAADVLIAVVIAGLVLEEVINGHTTTVPVILVLSLVGFAAAVSVARLVAAREAPRLAVAPEGRAGNPDRPAPPSDRGPIGEPAEESEDTR